MLIRRLAPAGFHATRHIVRFDAAATITGSSGAVASTAGRGLTIARSAQGVYTATIIGGTSGVGAILQALGSVVCDTPYVVTVKSAVASTGIVTFECHLLDDTTGNTELPAAAVLMITLIVRDSPSDAS